MEWIFNDIATYFKFIDFKKNLKIGLSSAGKMYVVCAILRDAFTCLYGNQTSRLFELDHPFFHEYFVWTIHDGYELVIYILGCPSSQRPWYTWTRPYKIVLLFFFHTLVVFQTCVNSMDIFHVGFVRINSVSGKCSVFYYCSKKHPAPSLWSLINDPHRAIPLKFKILGYYVGNTPCKNNTRPLPPHWDSSSSLLQN